MKKSGNYKGGSWRALWLLAMLFPIYMFGQDAAGDPVKGKDLFKANCAACHKSATGWGYREKICGVAPQVDQKQPSLDCLW